MLSNVLDIYVILNWKLMWILPLSQIEFVYFFVRTIEKCNLSWSWRFCTRTVCVARICTELIFSISECQCFFYSADEMFEYSNVFEVWIYSYGVSTAHMRICIFCRKKREFILRCLSWLEYVKPVTAQTFQRIQMFAHVRDMRVKWTRWTCWVLFRILLICILQ